MVSQRTVRVGEGLTIMFIETSHGDIVDPCVANKSACIFTETRMSLQSARVIPKTPLIQAFAKACLPCAKSLCPTVRQFAMCNAASFRDEAGSIQQRNADPAKSTGLMWTLLCCASCALNCNSRDSPCRRKSGGGNCGMV